MKIRKSAENDLRYFLFYIPPLHAAFAFGIFMPAGTLELAGLLQIIPVSCPGFLSVPLNPTSKHVTGCAEQVPMVIS
jgi:hypothetical protein